MNGKRKRNHALSFTAKSKDNELANVSQEDLERAKSLYASAKAKMVAGPAVEALGQVVGGLQVFVALNEEGGPLTNAPQPIKDTNTQIIKLVKQMVDQLNEAVGNIPRAEGAEKPETPTAPTPPNKIKQDEEK